MPTESTNQRQKALERDKDHPHHPQSCTQRCYIQTSTIITTPTTISTRLYNSPAACVSNTSLCLPHLLWLNELWGLIMILLPAENSTEKMFPSSVCIGDKPKTDVHMLSVVITVTAQMMRPHMWKKTICIWTCRHVVSHLVCSHYLKYIDVSTMQVDACALDLVFTTRVAALDVPLWF